MNQELVNKLAVLGATAFFVIAVVTCAAVGFVVLWAIRKRWYNRRRTVWMEIKLINAESVEFSVTEEAARELYADSRSGGYAISALRDRYGEPEQYGRTVSKVVFTDRKTGEPVVFDYNPKYFW